MKITTLDNRFRLKKRGLATHMIEVDVTSATDITKKMQDLYGRGECVYPGRKYWNVSNNRDWFYSFKQVKKSGITHLDARWTTSQMFYRIYFRREEQATFLILALS